MTLFVQERTKNMNVIGVNGISNANANHGYKKNARPQNFGQMLLTDIEAGSALAEKIARTGKKTRRMSGKTPIKNKKHTQKKLMTWAEQKVKVQIPLELFIQSKLLHEAYNIVE